MNKKKRAPLKKILVLTVILGSLFSAQNVLANDKTLSRSCLKNNLLVIGETDANLIEIYDAYCDKKNADAKYSYLAKAAQRFQQLGKNWKALQIINELETLNLRGNTITDVKFLASASLANEAVNQMRSTENRYLTSDITYPIAKQLVESINSAKSSSILLIEKPVQVQERAPIRNRTTKTPVKQNTKSSTSVQKNTNKSTPKAVAPKAPSNSSSGDPFGFTKK